MGYVALYRTYRPKTFSDVVGQDAVVQTLLNALEFNKTTHAYLFSGPRGTGKTSVAKLFGKAINCFREDDESYPGCEAYETLQTSDMTDIIELDAASNNGVDEIRDIRDKVKYMPSLGKYKVYIIDEVHMLTTGAFNALLKTLEEPPKHVIFILATTEIHKIPATILSRCQRFDFSLVDHHKIVERLSFICEKETIDITDEAIDVVAKNAQGSVRDAISLLDQVSAYAHGKITPELVYEVSGNVSNEDLIDLFKSISNKSHSDALETIKVLLKKGKEVSRILADFVELLRDFLTAKATQHKKHPNYQMIENISFSKLYHYLEVMNKLQYDIKFTSQKEAYLELAIIKMIEHQTIVQADLMTEIQQLRQELETLKKQGVQVRKDESSAVDNSTSKNTALPKKDKKTKETPLVTVKDVVDILSQSDKQKKDLLLKAWPRLEHYDEPGYELTGHMLFQGSLEAVSEEMLLVYDDIRLCERMYEPEVKKQVLFIMNQKRDFIKGYKAILREDWAKIKSQFVEAWKQGNKSPVLEEFDLNLYESKNTNKKESEIITLAKEYFGDDIEVKG